MKSIKLFNSIRLVSELINSEASQASQDDVIVDRINVALRVCVYASCLAGLHYRFTGEHTVVTRGHIESTVHGMLENAMNMCGVPHYDRVLDDLFNCNTDTEGAVIRR